MAKKKVVQEEEGSVEETVKTPVNAVIFVNSDKVLRAKDILALINGKRIPLGQGEADQKDKFAGFMAAEDINPKSEAALQFVYEKLGGLVRTVREQAAADEAAAEAKAKGRRRAIEA